jgi:membrane associated rhomboid family serine protease
MMSTLGIAFYSFLPGIIPAAITGGIYQRWLYCAQPNGGRTREVLAGFIIGYCVTATLIFLLFSSIKPDIKMSIWLGLIGGFAGAVCAYLDKRRRRKMYEPPAAEITESRIPLFQSKRYEA